MSGDLTHGERLRRLEEARPERAVWEARQEAQMAALCLRVDANGEAAQRLGEQMNEQHEALMAAIEKQGRQIIKLIDNQDRSIDELDRDQGILSERTAKLELAQSEKEGERRAMRLVFLGGGGIVGGAITWFTDLFGFGIKGG